MSKANSAIKVLRTALKRVQKGWTKGAWNKRMPDGGHAVCLEGAIYGYCETAQTDAQRKAIRQVEAVIKERFPDIFGRHPDRPIPAFNDRAETTQEELLEVIKLAIIREESGFDPDRPDDWLDDEQIDDLLESL